ncbi:MAG: glycoside hydrolase family 31 protein [Eubacteriales bacterium]|nr:glycoside hydrolase family 31 protein [Eubacteriales bacterium]
MLGCKDDELITRWLQFGVFSPIMRLHSSCNMFSGKEPWNYDEVSCRIMIEYLQLRHRMIPYLYTMNYYASEKCIPLVRPMYYLHPEEQNAYDMKNEYYFGTEMIVCPVTHKMNGIIRRASETVWIPEGYWYNFFNGRGYRGNRKLKVYSNYREMPVFVKAGGIIPLKDMKQNINSTDNPADMEIEVFPGNSNTFVLYEDDDRKESKSAMTELEWDW